MSLSVLYCFLIGKWKKDVASCTITLLRVTFRSESFAEIYPLITPLEIVDIESVGYDIFRNIKQQGKNYLDVICNNEASR